MGTVIFIFLSLSLCHKAFSQSTEYPEVHAKAGHIRGLKATDGEYNMFLGIPYARVNLSNPFGLPIEQPQFDGVFEAFTETVRCVQLLEILSPKIYVNCLQLNVFVPTSASVDKPLPVLVWIHGGYFIAGWGGIPLTGPQFLVKQDIILVSLNYRLGVYGFMCLDIPEVPGNAGLRDQIEGLKWVKENIAAFGGDSDKITIMGESAGGASVDYILRFNKQKLFDKVIIQSGTSNSIWTTPKKPSKTYAIDLARIMGFRTDNTHKALTYLSKVNAALLMLPSVMADINISLPCIENEYDSVERLINEDPTTTDIPYVRDTAILIGYNNAEMGVTILDLPIFYSENTFKQAANMVGLYEKEAEEVALMMKQFYIGDTLPEDMDSDKMRDYIDFNSDLRFLYPSEQAIDSYIVNGATKIYRYQFSYVGNRSYFHSLTGASLDGAVHGEELGYLFGLFVLTKPTNKQDQLMIDRLTTMWANFAKFGDPTPEVSPLLPVKWPPIDPEASYYMQIDKELVVSTRPNRERMAVWELLQNFKNQKKSYQFQKNNLNDSLYKFLTPYILLLRRGKKHV